MLYAGEIGQYYGVQGTTWKAAPILDNPTDEVRMRKRTYQRYFDGTQDPADRLGDAEGRLLGLEHAAQTLTNRQMMDIARSLERMR